MKLLTGIIGTTLLAFTCVATSNVAMAGGHEKMHKYQAQEKKKGGKYVYLCKERSHRLKREGKRYWCYYKVKHNNKKMRNNNNQVQKCGSGLKLYKNDANQFRCAKRAPAGWRIANNRGNNQIVNVIFKDVTWHRQNNRKYAECPRNYRILKKGNQVRCFQNAQRGWSGYNGPVWKGGNGGSMGMQNGGGKYPYDKYRYMRGNTPACKQGRATYNNYHFHCVN